MNNLTLLSDSESVWPENPCGSLEQLLSQADQQRRWLLEAVLAEALGEPEKALEGMA